jgi:hypothetical protein
MDVESGMAEAMSFAETRVRNGFVRKVFSIVAIQIAITVAFACACIYVDEIRVRFVLGEAIVAGPTYKWC